MELNREFPKVYCEFEGKKVVDGKRKQFWIQDATEEWFPSIIENLTNKFIGDEPTTKYLECQNDPESIEFFGDLWSKVLQEHCSIVCLTRDMVGAVSLAGFNILVISTEEETKFEVKGKAAKIVFKVMEYADIQRDFHKEFNMPKYMSALGLFVLPEFRGEGLGERILDARELLCRNLHVGATVTAFTSVISQKLAERVGFHDLYVEEYTRLGEIDPAMKIPGIEAHTRYFKNMYKIYDEER